MDKIKIGVMGACGKMGQEICRTILDDSDLELAAAIDVINQGYDIGLLVGRPKVGVCIETNFNNLVQSIKLDVLVDFTNAQALLNNVPKALSQGINLVIGTTGLTSEEIEDIQKMAEDNNAGVFIAPNFAIGAVLMIKFAKEAAKYLPHIEIIEKHHDQKLDAPSGTAIKTLEEISKIRMPLVQGNPKEYEKISRVRGGDYQGIKVHSMRLPGLIAHQEIIFGGVGQTLTIKHDSLSRESFMPGIILACKKVITWKGLVYGLENILPDA
ncbi:MAG: dihydrodipicolinate reductase [Clostridiaceae bacterium BRH_c20a]|nr:MAG: dihydrodipicolinate reductase [Clostridiaceae bacterium BRH_c20a]